MQVNAYLHFLAMTGNLRVVLTHLFKRTSIEDVVVGAVFKMICIELLAEKTYH